MEEEKINSVINFLPSSFYVKKTLVCYLGGGTYGSVFIVKEDGTYKACKFINRKRILSKDNIPPEAIILKNLDHPNIIKFIDLEIDEKFYYIYTEIHGICDKTMKSSNTNFIIKSSDCFEFIENNSVSESQSKFILKQILSVFNYLHSRNIIYLDFKDENILIDANTLQIKFCDFGSAYHVRNLQTLIYEVSGTANFIPPEVLSKRGYFPLPCEIWTIGCFLFILATKILPFSDSSEIVSKQTPIIKNYSLLFQNLVNKCTEKDPKKRITFTEINSHPWVNGYR